MRPLYALYADPEAAQRAIASLREAGVAMRDIVVISSEPLEDYEWGWPKRPSRMGWLAALGGLLGGTCGYLLTSYTQQAYPLVTGSMPIVTRWTNGIILYELTMLGAILATLVTFLISARLPDWRPQLYDSEISEGKILVGLAKVPEAARGELEQKLQRAAQAPP